MLTHVELSWQMEGWRHSFKSERATHGRSFRKILTFDIEWGFWPLSFLPVDVFLSNQEINSNMLIPSDDRISEKLLSTGLSFLRSRVLSCHELSLALQVELCFANRTKISFSQIQCSSELIVKSVSSARNARHLGVHLASASSFVCLVPIYCNPPLFR